MFRLSWRLENPLVATIGNRGLDIALDPVGGGATAACRRQLGPMGRLVVYGMSCAVPGIRRNWFAAALAWLRTSRIHPMSLVRENISISGVHLLHLSRREELVQRAIQEMLPRFQSGELRPVIDRVFSLDRDGAVQAHRRLHARENLGKVVLSLSLSPSVSLLRTTLPWEDRGFQPVRPMIEKSPPNRAFSIHDLVLRGRLEPGKFTEFSSEIRRKVII